MGLLIRKNKILFIIAIFLLTTSVFGQDKSKQPPNGKDKTPYFGYGTHVDLYIGLGVSYVINISTDMKNKADLFSLTVPLSLAVDVRFIEWFSLYGGVEVVYGCDAFRTEHFSNTTTNIFFHSLQFRLPYTIRFYPFVYKSPSHENVFFGVGFVLSFTALNYYYIEQSNYTSSGSAYATTNKFVPTKDAYTPVNIGLKLSIGNNFVVAEKTTIGLELFCLYMFVPTINAYTNNNGYNLGGPDIVNFAFSIGIAFSVGIKTYSSITKTQP